jgi:molybdate transport system regulatory protein
MKTSARNHLDGTVSAITSGAVNDEVELTLPGGIRIVAVITRESTESLGLKKGAPAFALIKASSVIVATDLQGATISARNQLAGTVGQLTPGAVNAEVVIDIDGGGSVAAIVTRRARRTCSSPRARRRSRCSRPRASSWARPSEAAGSANKRRRAGVAHGA